LGSQSRGDFEAVYPKGRGELRKVGGSSGAYRKRYEPGTLTPSSAGRGRQEGVFVLVEKVKIIRGKGAIFAGR
jgi:hypothetical protein